MNELEVILYGADKTKNVTAIDYDEEESKAFWYIREKGKVKESSTKFQPFILLSSDKLLDQLKMAHSAVENLDGDEGFRYLVRFATARDYKDAYAKLGAYYRKEKDNLDEEPHFDVGDISHQFMLLSGMTHFLDTTWDQLKKLFISLKLSVNSEFANPKSEDQYIIVLAMKVGKEEILLNLDEMTEPEMIKLFVETVKEQDPDILCGHNLFKAHLNFIAERAKRYGISLELGRGSRVARLERYRMPLAERRLEFPRLRVFGRSLVDTWILVQSYDIFKREMDSYDLSYSATHLGVRKKERAEYCGLSPGENYTHRLAEIIDDAREDLNDLEGVSKVLIPTFFYFCQMLPYNLEDTIIRGNATKINSFLLREYLRRRCAIPFPVEARWFPGGFTEIRKTGVIKPVISADVASLYPSLILAKKLFPRTDRLGLFEKILNELLARRLEIKKELRKLSPEDKRYHYLDALQGTFKIIINSFYGYLGTDRMNFADIEVAEQVTALGQETVKKMAQAIEKLGGETIEIDTDGIFLKPPEKFVKGGDYQSFVDLINKEMKEGVEVELGGVYQAMLSYKVKNYALLTEDGSLIIKGSGLKSRGLEPFLRMFIESAIRLVLTGKEKEFDNLYRDFLARLKDGAFSVTELAKTETLVDSLDAYERKIKTTRRNRQAQYEVAKRIGAKYGIELKPGDSVTYYVSGDSAKVKAYEVAKHINEFNPDRPDINIPFYEKRLAETFKRVKEFTA